MSTVAAGIRGVYVTRVTHGRTDVCFDDDARRSEWKEKEFRDRIFRRLHLKTEYVTVDATRLSYFEGSFKCSLLFLRLEDPTAGSFAAPRYPDIHCAPGHCPSVNNGVPRILPVNVSIGFHLPSKANYTNVKITRDIKAQYVV